MSKPTVLVVDDEIGIRGLLAAILDYMLPEMDGVELGRRLRQRFGDTFPLVFTSAMDVPASKLAEVSSHLFVSKPFDIDSMLQAVQSALAPVQPRPLNAASAVEGHETGRRRRSARAL